MKIKNQKPRKQRNQGSDRASQQNPETTPRGSGCAVALRTTVSSQRTSNKSVEWLLLYWLFAMSHLSTVQLTRANLMDAGSKNKRGEINSA